MANASITYTADREFVRDVASAGTGNLTRQWRIPLAVAILAALLIVGIVRDHGWLWLVATAIPLALGVLLLSTAWRMRRRLEAQVAAQYADLPQPPRITVDADDDGLRFTNAAGSHELPWSEVEHVDRRSRVWFVRTRSGLSLPIPAAAIDDPMAAALRRDD